jgi:hypothetical protein
MRASSLSQPSIIALLKEQFVPVWLSVDDYALPAKSKADHEEWQRIYRASLDRRLTAGSVCVYIVAPSGEPIATMHVAEAAQPEKLLPMLQKVVRDRGLPPRSPEAIAAFARRAAATARPPAVPKPYLQVWTRHVGTDEGLGITEDRVTLTAAQWRALAPPVGARVGDRWEIPPAVRDRIYAYFFPPVGNYHASDSKVRRASLTATVDAASPDELTLSLRGDLEMDHRREKNNDGSLTARVRGEARYDSLRQVFTLFRLASEEAHFVWHYQSEAIPSRFAVAVDLVR